MSYVAPTAVVDGLIKAGTAKGRLPVRDLLLRGILSGALLGIATTLAFTTSIQTGLGIAGAIIFPVGFVMIVLLGLELVTGNFAVVPLALLDRRIGTSALLRNWSWVFLGNLVGSLIYAGLFFAATDAGTPIAERLVQVAEAKTLAYEAQGSEGMLQLFARAVLCNWMVTMGVVMAFTSTSTGAKVLAMWLPITTFFGQGFEHAVVNMFAIPAGMLFGADVSLAQWWAWNQVPVTLGNIVGGLLFTGLALYLTQRERTPAAASVPARPLEAVPAAGD